MSPFECTPEAWLTLISIAPAVRFWICRKGSGSNDELSHPTVGGLPTNQSLMTFPAERDQVGFCVITEGTALLHVVNIEILRATTRF
jgi:hypothetical protein